MSTPKPKNSAKITEKIVKQIVAKSPTDELSLMRANRQITRQFNLAPLPKREIAQTYDKLIKQKKLKSDPLNVIQILEHLFCFAFLF